MNSLVQDLRYALRSLAKTPGVTAIAVSTLALAIGANTAIFSVVRGILIRPLGFREPERLVALEEREKDGAPSNTSFATYVDWRTRNRSFEDVAATAYWSPKISESGTGPAEMLEGLRVTDGFLRLLGVRPVLGRDFLPSEQVDGNHRVVILGHGLWRRRFGGDPAIVGQTVRFSDTAYLVAGVLPPDFESVFSPYASRTTEIWAPLAYDPSEPWACRTCRHLRAFARLKAGKSLETARTDINALSAALFRENPADYAAPGVLVTPLGRRVTGDARPALTGLAVCVGFVLLIGCANVASLLLGRAAARRREVAVRRALGASAGRIARLFLAEAAVLALAGAALGLLGATWTLSTLTAAAPSLPRVASVHLDPAVLLFTLSVSLAAVLFFGAVPAMRQARIAPDPVLRESSRSTPARRSRRAGGLLVAFDAALALALLFGAGLLIKSTTRLLQVDPGFRAEGLLTMEVSLSGARYERDAAVLDFYDRLLAGIRGLPGVTAAAVVSQLPLGGDVDGYSVHVEGRASASPADDPSADRYSVSPDYLSAMGIPVQRGRGIEERDRAGGVPVVLINETLARRVFGREDPIGRRLRVGGNDDPWRTIVGVVGDVRHGGLDAPRTNQIYLPMTQFLRGATILVLRAAGDPALLSGAARKVVRGVDADQPLTRVATMEEVIAASTASRRFSRDLLAAFAALAALLAAVGIFGVVSAFVGRHTREIGIRVALGARRQSILAMIASRMFLYAMPGLAAGAVGALVLGRVLRGQLFDVAPADPAVLFAGALGILGVVLAATLLPARRAARIDPIEALRTE